MTYKISLANKSYNVRLSPKSNFKISVTSGGVQVPAKLGDLEDFDTSNANDKYVIMYDAASQKYVLVNPDVVLSAAASTETIQPGLPSDFQNALDIDLDNKIDLDAGTF